MIADLSRVSFLIREAACLSPEWFGLAVLGFCCRRLTLTLTYALTLGFALFHPHNGRRREAREILFRHPLTRPPHDDPTRRRRHGDRSRPVMPHSDP